LHYTILNYAFIYLYIFYLKINEYIEIYSLDTFTVGIGGVNSILRKVIFSWCDNFVMLNYYFKMTLKFKYILCVTDTYGNDILHFVLQPERWLSVLISFHKKEIKSKNEQLVSFHEVIASLLTWLWYYLTSTFLHLNWLLNIGEKELQIWCKWYLRNAFFNSN
jgi:hypothetical protein